MNRFLLVAVALSASISATGCLPIGGCSAYTGASDMVYQHGNDMLIVCSNGGYSATLGTTTMEGLSGNGNLTNGTTGAIASTMVADQTTGDVTAFGSAGWTAVALDQTALDHADVMCSDLLTRAWWATPGLLPVSVKLARPAANFATTENCIEAQAAGGYPADASCQDELDLCADGTAIATLADGPVTGSYSSNAGALSISMYVGTALYRGATLEMPGEAIWTTAAVSPQAVSKCAK